MTGLVLERDPRPRSVTSPASATSPAPPRDARLLPRARGGLGRGRFLLVSSVVCGITLATVSAAAEEQAEKPSQEAPQDERTVFAESGETAPAGTATMTQEEVPRPKMNVTVAPNEPPTQRKAYVHNGFYLRVGVGPGYQYSAAREKSSNENFDAHAFVMEADLLIGGSPSPGIALGGGALFQLVPSADFGFDGRETVANFTVGPFLDAFPNDRDGFHMGVLFGMSGMFINEEVGSLLGGGANGWVGYDLWVAPEWSTGIHLELGASFHGGSDYRGATFHSTVMLTLLNH